MTIISTDITDPEHLIPDSKVDMRDIGVAAWAIGSYPTHPRWDSYADINQDDRLDMKDLVIIARNFGKTYL